MNFPHLFSPIEIGKVVLPNRVAMAPMGTHLQSKEGYVTEQLLSYLERRAKGGTGLLITPFAAVVPGQPTFGAYSDDMIDGLQELARRVKTHGSRIFLQISHLGAAAPKNPVAASSFLSPFYSTVPRELTINQIKTLQEQFANAALRARKAGFDGVEIHGGYAYLIASFYSPHLNRRNDRYGGKEGGLLFIRELISKIRDKVGDFPLGFKMNAHEHVEGGIDLQFAVEFAKFLQLMGINYIHVVSSHRMDCSCKFSAVPTIYDLNPGLPQLARKIKDVVDVPVFAAGGIDDPETAEHLLAKGTADVVVIGRGLIADPDWPNKVREGELYRPCIRCNICHIREVMDSKPVRCSVNPLAGNELKHNKIGKARKIKKVVIVGGGPAGIQAAITTATRGHSVTLFEKSDTLGGMMRLAGVPKFKKRVRLFTEYLIKQLYKSAINIQLETNVTSSMLFDLDPDVVVLATGSRPNGLNIKGLKGNYFVSTAIDFLKSPQNLEASKDIVIVGANTVGCELSWYIWEKYRIRSTLVDKRPYSSLLKEQHPLNRADLLGKLREIGIAFLCEAVPIRVEERVLWLQSEAESPKAVPFDNLILATGMRSEKSLLEALNRKHPMFQIFSIGDCVKPRDIYAAIHDGFEVGNQI